MPRLGIKAQVSLLSLGLLALPLIGFSYWQQVKDSTLETQAHIQQIEAKAIATSLLATQEDISALLAANEESELYKYSLAAPLLNIHLKLDGYLDDWPSALVRQSKTKFNKINWQADTQQTLETEFELQLAQTSQHLYVGMQVIDSLISYRRNHLRLDYSDHIRLSFLNPQNQITRIIIPAEHEGALASYFTNHEWEYGHDPSPDKASHETELQGFWRRHALGYSVEFRIPLELMGTDNAQVHIALVDVDEQPSLGPKAIIETLPSSFDKQFNPLELHARQLQRVINHLKSTYAHLGIFDRRGREWAYAGRESSQSTFELSPSCLNSALEGKTQQYQHATALKDADVHITTCYPINQNNETIGVIVIDEIASHVLEQQKGRIQTIALKTAIIVCAIVLTLFIYALFLARRITQLNQATCDALDDHGRIIKRFVSPSRNSPDELGDLSRSISSLLEQQKTYTEFLERMPGTLRHEIFNPLNKVRTSLENLLDEKPELETNVYIKKLDAGVDQIGNITQLLTEAASIENALHNETLKRLNLTKFLHDYCSVWERLESQIPDTDIYIMAESSRLEQMLDKLLDNAYSFCSENGGVRIKLTHTTYSVQLNVENDGPTIPESRFNEIFSPMISSRSEGMEVHLGLGLHIAKIIADYHFARLSCQNREDNSGVVFTLFFSPA